MYCVWQFVKTPTIIFNNPVFSVSYPVFLLPMKLLPVALLNLHTKQLQLYRYSNTTCCVVQCVSFIGIYSVLHLLHKALTWGLDPLAKGTKSVTVCHDSKSINQIAVKHCAVLQAVSGYCWTGTEGGNVKCGKCGAVERALCGGCNGGLSCICTASYSVGTGGSAVRHETRKTATLCYT